MHADALAATAGYLKRIAAPCPWPPTEAWVGPLRSRTPQLVTPFGRA